MADDQTDKAGREYWDASWRQQAGQRPVDPRARGLRNHLRRCFHNYFRQTLGAVLPRGARVLEVGCADSIWLPYFNRELGYEIGGLDYSPDGCDKARALLAREQVGGQVYQADMFDPPAALNGAFDAVFSYGLVEHFSDTATAVRALRRFVRPGGWVLTLVPNMTGLNGKLQRWFDRRVYDLHVPLDLPALVAAHERAGLEVVDRRYLLSLNFGVLAATGGSGLARASKRGIHTALIASQLPLWWLESRGATLVAPNPVSSPYVAVFARS